MRRTSTTIGALAVAVVLAVTGCSSGSDEPAISSPSQNAPLLGADATTTRAADLRAELTYLLEERVQLVGIATHTALEARGQLADPVVKAALAALDTNSVALSKVIGAAYPAAQAPFLASWRQHVGFLVEYTLGRYTRNAGRVASAKADLDGFRSSFGKLLNDLVPELPAEDMASELKPHVARLLTAIDAQVAGSPKQFALLQDAAAHTPDEAAILAGGIASNLKLGVTDRPAADLRAGLTALLTQHVYAVGIAIDTAVSQGGDLRDSRVRAAVSALDANSVALSKAIGDAYPRAEAPFLETWRQHIGSFMSYGLGKATKNAKQVGAARSGLDSYRTFFGQLISSVVPKLSADVVASELEPGVTSLFAAIDANVDRDSSFFAKLELAASYAPGTAAVLAGGIAQDLKLN